MAENKSVIDFVNENMNRLRIVGRGKLTLTWLSTDVTKPFGLTFSNEESLPLVD